MREYHVPWDGSNPEDARLLVEACREEPGEDLAWRGRRVEADGPQMGEPVIARDLLGRAWPARVAWDLRLGWVLVPQPSKPPSAEPLER